jgi:hypothetical protein
LHVPRILQAVDFLLEARTILDLDDAAPIPSHQNLAGDHGVEEANSSRRCALHALIQVGSASADMGLAMK